MNLAMLETMAFVDWSSLPSISVALLTVIFVVVISKLVFNRFYLDSRSVYSPNPRQPNSKIEAKSPKEIQPIDLCEAPEPHSLTCDSDGKVLYWRTSLRDSRGRRMVVKHILKSCLCGMQEVESPLELDLDVRSCLTDVGLSCFIPFEGGILSSNHSDNRIYRTLPESEGGGREIMPLTQPSTSRFGYFDLDLSRSRVSHFGSLINVYLLCVRDDDEAQAIVTINLSSPSTLPKVLARGRARYWSPRVSPDGQKLAYLCSDEAAKPESVELWVADLASGEVTREVCLGHNMVQPRWCPDGSALCFLSNVSGWWNLYRLRTEELHRGQEGAEPLTALKANCSENPWLHGASDYALVKGAAAVTCRRDDGTSALYLIPFSVQTIHDPIEAYCPDKINIGGICAEPTTEFDTEAQFFCVATRAGDATDRTPAIYGIRTTWKYCRWEKMSKQSNGAQPFREL